MISEVILANSEISIGLSGYDHAMNKAAVMAGFIWNLRGWFCLGYDG